MKDEEWTWLLHGLWKYQWTDPKAALDQKFIDVMWVNCILQSLFM